MKTSLLLVVLATMVPRGALGHATEIRHCITIDGMLRIFIQHWHGETAPGAGDTMDLRADHAGGSVFTKRPTGHVNNVPDVQTGLPGCEFTISDAVTQCHDENHDDWVWYDFQAEIGVQVSYTLLAGNSVMLEEGCAELLPVTITGVLTMPTPEEIAMQRELAWTKQFDATVDFWNDPDARLKATPLEMRTFIMDPFDLNFPDKVSNGRWVKDTEDKNWQERQGRMAEASGRLLFTFGSRTASCSGTAVRDYASSDRSVIVTAAHCIYEEQTKTFATNIIFIPNQDDGSDTGISNRNCDDDPYGCWVPEFAVVDSEWASNINDVTHDFGFLVVKNKGAHAGPGGRDLALEDAVRAIDIDWNDQANLQAGSSSVFSMGLPGSWSNQLRYARGRLRVEKNLQFVEGCTLKEGASGGPMPANPLDETPRLFSVNSFKSGYFDDDGEFIQTSCGGPILTKNSYCKLLEVAESLEFGSPEALADGGIIVPYENSGCTLPGWCDTDEECDNGIFCDGVEQCIENACVSSGDPCDGFRCSEKDGVCLDPCTEDSQCDDGIFCNGAEACINGKCLDGPGNPCANGEMCEPFKDKCMPAECTKDLDCTDDVFCNGHEMCIEGACQEGVLPCDADEDCYEVSGQCANQVCKILDDETMCQDDDVNDCCVCMEWCGPQDSSIVECGAFLFFPRPINYDFEKTDEWGTYTPEYLEYLEAANKQTFDNSTNSTDLLTNSSDLLGNLLDNRTRWLQEEKPHDRVPAFPTCLMWTLFMDGKAPTRFTEV